MTKRILKEMIEDLKKKPITSPQEPPAVDVEAVKIKTTSDIKTAKIKTASDVEITKIKIASVEKIAKLKILESVSIALIKGIITIYGIKVLLEQQLYSSHSIVVIFLLYIYLFKEDGKKLDWFDVICICALMLCIMTKIGAF